jgi:hypothetical protein
MASSKDADNAPNPVDLAEPHPSTAFREPFAFTALRSGRAEFRSGCFRDVLSIFENSRTVMRSVTDFKSTNMP